MAAARYGWPMTSSADRSRDGTGRALTALRQHIGRSPLSQRKIEERVGFSRGYLSQLLSGRLDLKLVPLLRVLDALALPPGRFFRQVHSRPQRTALEALRKRARQRHLEPPSGLDRIRGLGDLGVESVASLRRRLERCERALSELETLGIVSTNRSSHDV